jgi:hypothetical protein
LKDERNLELKKGSVGTVKILRDTGCELADEDKKFFNRRTTRWGRHCHDNNW